MRPVKLVVNVSAVMDRNEEEVIVHQVVLINGHKHRHIPSAKAEKAKTVCQGTLATIDIFLNSVPESFNVEIYANDGVAVRLLEQGRASTPEVHHLVQKIRARVTKKKLKISYMHGGVEDACDFLGDGIWDDGSI